MLSKVNSWLTLRSKCSNFWNYSVHYRVTWPCSEPNKSTKQPHTIFVQGSVLCYFRAAPRHSKSSLFMLADQNFEKNPYFFYIPFFHIFLDSIRLIMFLEWYKSEFPHCAVLRFLFLPSSSSKPSIFPKLLSRSSPDTLWVTLTYVINSITDLSTYWRRIMKRSKAK